MICGDLFQTTIILRFITVSQKIRQAIKRMEMTAAAAAGVTKPGGRARSLGNTCALGLGWRNVAQAGVCIACTIFARKT